MSLKQVFIETLKVLFEKAESPGSLEAEIRAFVEALNMMRKSTLLFEIAMEEQGFGKMQSAFLAGLSIPCDELRPFWKLHLGNVLKGEERRSMGSVGSSDSTNSAVFDNRPLRLPEITKFSGENGQFANWYAMTKQLLTSNEIPMKQWPGAILRGVSG